MERAKVVAEYANGKIIKGYTLNFFPHKDRFHVIPIDKPSDKPTEVFVNQLKAVFVVQDFNENPQYVERRGYMEGETPYGTPLEVTFEDGEVMVGSCMGIDLKRQGFFISPPDPKSNNLRVFVVCSAVKGIRRLLLKTGGYVEVPISVRKQ